MSKYQLPDPEAKKYYTNLIPAQGLTTLLTQRNSTPDAVLLQEKITKPLFQMNQVHSGTVTYVNAYSQNPVPDTDAIFTDDQRIILAVRTADCLPVLIYHPKGIVAAIHAGRAGTEQKILLHTIETLKKYFEITTGFYIWLGPAICKSCYQINREQDLHYDLLLHNKKQLNTILPPPDYNLYEANVCTRCRNDLFFSYREEGAKAGRIYSLIGIT